MFHHVGLSWMIETKAQCHFILDENYEEWFTGSPWFNETTCRNPPGPLFYELFVTERQDRYDLMCVLHDLKKR